MQKNFLATNNDINYWAIIPAAGIGTRMQNTLPKQYLTLNNQEVIVHSINKLLSTKIFSKIIVVLAPTDNYFQKLNIANNNHIITTIGGSQRYNSVLNGIKKIQQTQKYSLNDWVLVHDAARPCLTKQDITLLINKLHNDTTGGILGYPASDTIKIVDQQHNIQSTPDRSVLWHAVTPQMFRMGVLLESLEYCIKQNIAVTDEASAVESSGYNPKIFNGSVGNIKVTTQEDMLLAEYYLQQAKED
jgi:2-C-methyl-D-erythritol 4-phosphate cytidylyltransferase